MQQIDFEKGWRLEYFEDRALYVAWCQCGDGFIVRSVDDALDALGHKCWGSL